MRTLHGKFCLKFCKLSYVKFCKLSSALSDFVCFGMMNEAITNLIIESYVVYTITRRRLHQNSRIYAPTQASTYAINTRTHLHICTYTLIDVCTDILCILQRMQFSHNRICNVTKRKKKQRCYLCLLTANLNMNYHSLYIVHRIRYTT